MHVRLVLAGRCLSAGRSEVRLAHALYLKAIHGGKNKNDRIDSEKIAHLLRANLIPPAYVYPAALRPLRALWRQRLCYVWRRAELLARIQSQELAQNRCPIKQSRPNRDPWEKQLLAREENPLRQLALQNDLAMIRCYDQQITALEEKLHQLTQALAQRLEAKFNGNKFKANTVLAIKLARAVYYMLQNKTVFDPARLVAALARN